MPLRSYFDGLVGKAAGRMRNALSGTPAAPRRDYLAVIESGDIPTHGETESLRRLLYRIVLREEEDGTETETERGEWTQHELGAAYAERYVQLQERDTENWENFKEVNATRKRNLRREDVQKDRVYGKIYRAYYILCATLLRHLKSIQYHRQGDTAYMERQFALMEQIIGNMETLVRHYGDYVQLLIMMPLEPYMRSEPDMEQLRTAVDALETVVRTVLCEDVESGEPL